jgi:hypothetical protein
MFAELKVNPYNLSVVIFVALGTISTAYGLAIIGSTVGQPNFYTYFKLAAAGEPGNYHYTFLPDSYSSDQIMTTPPTLSAPSTASTARAPCSAASSTPGPASATPANTA